MPDEGKEVISMGHCGLIKVLVILGIGVCAARGACGATLYVGPAEAHLNIQAAIDAASNGDIIIVRDGTYTGPGNRDIEFRGKGIHLKSENGPGNCTVSAQGTEAEMHCGFIFQSGGADAALEGFTITGGYNDLGGGIYISGSAPTILGNVIQMNTANDSGGGIWCDGEAQIRGNTISQNTAIGNGGGIYAIGQSTIIGNTIAGNTGKQNGGGIHSTDSSILENTIDGNSTWFYDGGGLYVTGGVIAGNVIRGNSAARKGGGAYTRSPLSNNVIANNTATDGAGILYSLTPIGHISNLTLYGNSATTSAFRAALHVEGSGTLVVSSSIFWDTLREIVVLGGSVALRYSTVKGGQGNCFAGASATLGWGAGNIASDPLFAEPANGDYHLKSVLGRWDPKANGGAGGWVIDSVHSPCLDTGDPVDSWANEPVPNGGRINMGAYGNTPQASRSAARFLTVRSSGVAGVSIDGDKPGTTEYLAGCDDQQVVTLIAPQNAISGSTRYRFVRWVLDGVDQSEGAANLQITMNVNRIATANYQLLTHILAVESSPITSVSISGTKPGTTNYAATCNDQDAVSLAAPASVSSGGRDYDFLRWTLDGADMPDGQASVSIMMDDDRTASAVYEARPWRLSVQSSIPGIPIGGNVPGVTDYSAWCKAGQAVNLLAPRSTTYQGMNYCFKRWRLDGAAMASGEQALSITMNADHTAVAECDVCTWTLSVQSFPEGGAVVAGDKPGTTPFSAGCVDGEIVQLSASAMIIVDGKTWYFAYWLIDAAAQPRYRRDAYITVNRDVTAIAVYDPTLRGDVNGDCKVNVLDLIDARNRLGDECSP